MSTRNTCPRQYLTLVFSYKTYANRYKDWHLPVDRCEREQAVRELFALVSDSSNYQATTSSISTRGRGYPFDPSNHILVPHYHPYHKSRNDHHIAYRKTSCFRRTNNAMFETRIKCRLQRQQVVQHGHLEVHNRTILIKMIPSLTPASPYQHSTRH